MAQGSGSSAFDVDELPAAPAPAPSVPQRAARSPEVNVIAADVSSRPLQRETTPELVRDPLVSFTRATDGGVRVEDFLAQVDANCVAGADTNIQGSIEVGNKKSVIVRGQVTGDVICEAFVLVLPGAWIQGSVRAAHLWVEGKIAPHTPGTVTTVDVGVLHLGVGGRIESDVVYDMMTQSKGSLGIAGRVSDRSYAEAQS